MNTKHFHSKQEYIDWVDKTKTIVEYYENKNGVLIVYIPGKKEKPHRVNIRRSIYNDSTHRVHNG